MPDTKHNEISGDASNCQIVSDIILRSSLYFLRAFKL